MPHLLGFKGADFGFPFLRFEPSPVNFLFPAGGMSIGVWSLISLFWASLGECAIPVDTCRIRMRWVPVPGSSENEPKGGQCKSKGRSTDRSGMVEV